MQVYDNQALLQKFAGRQIKVEGYFLRRTNLQSHQTILKLGEYNLSCIPAFFSFEEVQLLAVLTPSEVALFSKFKDQTSTLVMAFLNAESRDAARLHIRITLTAITPLPERKNVCLLQVRFKTLPSELIQILGAYLEEQEDRRDTYEKYGEEKIEMSAENTQVLGYNNYAELTFQGEKFKVRLKNFSSKQAELVLPTTLEDHPVPAETQLKLYFRSGPISIDGTLTQGSVFLMNFSNDILSLIEDFHFRMTMMNKRRGGPGQ